MRDRPEGQAHQTRAGVMSPVQRIIGRLAAMPADEAVIAIRFLEAFLALPLTDSAPTPEALSENKSGDCGLWMNGAFASDMFATFLTPQGKVGVYHAKSLHDPWRLVSVYGDDKTSSPTA